jgi:Peptidase family S51
MRFLLTSAGIKNASIHDALVDPLGKPIPESNALCIPTATHALGEPEHWMRQSGLADPLPSLRAVYVGLSAGSIVMAPNIGEEFVSWKPPTGGDKTLGVVGSSMFPHLDHDDLPENTMADAEKWAAGMQVPAYAIDDQTAIKVTDGIVEVVSEGHWKLFTPSPEASESGS